MLTGYLHPDYALSLAEFGKPRLLPQSYGWVLERSILGFSFRDAMGIYPLFMCLNWAKLHEDLGALNSELVSLVIVTDPFGEYDTDGLQKCFPHLVTPFKDHFISELNVPANKFVSKHHRYYAKKAFERLRVEYCETPIDFLDEWTELYGHLIARHKVEGIRAFSRNAFSHQLQIPGLVMFRAVLEQTTVGIHLWYKQDNVAYSHLLAVNSLGYEFMASYALYWYAIEYFMGHVRYLDLGAGAGSNSESTGLTQFKKGWSTQTKMTYLCGRVFDFAKYNQITITRNIASQDYFPSYRQGEFT